MQRMAKSIRYGKSYLLWYAHDLVNFKIQELEAIASCFNIKFEWHEEPCIKDPYLLINLSSASDMRKIMSRSVMIRSAYELWGASHTRKDLHSQLKLVPNEFTKPFYKSDVSFRIMVESFGKKLSRSEKISRIDELAFMSFAGSIRLENPDFSFLLMEYYGTDPNSIPECPYRIFFGRWICDGQRKISQKISLKVRKFIGNTSMDPLLSLVMANMARIQPGHLVLDPFVGSGGLLVAAACFGAYVVGTDIDYLMLHGKAKPTRYKQNKREPDESIRANLRQYGMETQYLDAIVGDAALPLWRTGIQFDAIVTDPPYGIREPTERIGTEKNYTIPGHLAASHIPSKVTYNLRDMIKDMLDFSASHLVLNGRLVFWMPAYKEDFDQNNLAYHPCLELVGCSEQPLTRHSSRYLITMEKVRETNENEQYEVSVCESAKSFRYKYFQAHKKREFLSHANSEAVIE